MAQFKFVHFLRNFIAIFILIGDALSKPCPNQYFENVLEKSNLYLSNIDVIERQTKTQTATGLQLFSNGNCTGRSQWFFSDFPRLETPFNDEASCAKVHGTHSWIVYEHYGYHGKSVFLMGGERNTSIVVYDHLRRFAINSKISAARQITSSGVYLFEYSHLSGAYSTFQSNQSHSSLTSFDNTDPSLIVFDECIQVFQHGGYTGGVLRELGNGLSIYKTDPLTLELGNGVTRLIAFTHVDALRERLTGFPDPLLVFKPHCNIDA